MQLAWSLKNKDFTCKNFLGHGHLKETSIMGTKTWFLVSFVGSNDDGSFNVNVGSCDSIMPRRKLANSSWEWIKRDMICQLPINSHY
jgi:hypothetical protein